MLESDGDMALLKVSSEAVESIQPDPSVEASSISSSTTSDPSIHRQHDMSKKPKEQKGASRRPKSPKSSPEGLTFADHRERLAGEIKALIADSGKSQSAWARAIGVSQSTVSSVLAGRHKRRDHFDSLARELGYAINQDFELVERAPKRAPAPRQERPDRVEDSSVEADVPSAVEREVVSVGESTSAPVRLQLDPSQEALIEWSAAQRGIEPRIWLMLAVAAYHEAQGVG